MTILNILKVKTEEDSRRCFFGCGIKVRVKSGAFEGLTGTCSGFSIFNVEVEMDDNKLGNKDFCPENLEILE